MPEVSWFRAYRAAVVPRAFTKFVTEVALFPWETRYSGRSVSSLPSVFCVGTYHDSVAVSVAGAVMVVVKAGNDDEVVPSLTVIAMLTYARVRGSWCARQRAGGGAERGPTRLAAASVLPSASPAVSVKLYVWIAHDLVDRQ